MNALKVFPSVPALPDLVVTLYVLPLSTVLDGEDPDVLVWAHEPSFIETAWLYGPVKSVKPGSSKKPFFLQLLY